MNRITFRAKYTYYKHWHFILSIIYALFPGSNAYSWISTEFGSLLIRSYFTATIQISARLCVIALRSTTLCVSFPFFSHYLFIFRPTERIRLEENGGQEGNAQYPTREECQRNRAAIPALIWLKWLEMRVKLQLGYNPAKSKSEGRKYF